MNCPNCGAPMANGTAFCTNCGTRIPDQTPAQPAYAVKNAPGVPVRFPQRNIGISILLSLVTCGIYSFIWLINIINDLNEAAPERNPVNPIQVILLSIFTCGIYEMFWMYKAGDQINNAKASRGLSTNPNSGLIFLFFSLVSPCGVLALAMMQNELNKVAELYGAPVA